MASILKTKDLRKTYPGVVALDDVSFEVEEGEVHALVGENGAGKSTLIKVITGAITPDSGEILFDGKPWKSLTPALSRSVGIEAIYQEFNLVPYLSVAENVFIGQRATPGPIVSFSKLNDKTKEVLSAYDVEIDPAARVSSLSIAKMQLVEITKAIARNARLLIMDEPTAPLTENEVEALFGIVAKLKKEGVTIIYISHRLDEIFSISDRVTVMRDGQYVITEQTKNMTKEKLIYHMVGREMTETFSGREIKYGEPVLEVKNVCGNGVKDISFTLRKGEILGLAGLVGAGRTELARVIFGAEKCDAGEILVDGRPVKIKSPGKAIALGIGLLTEDRKAQGVLLRLSIKWNTSITVLKQISNAFAVTSGRREKSLVEELKDSLKIKTPSIEQLVVNLSGGNQQKVALAKWLASKSKILIFDEPTRGIDVGAKQEIYTLMNELAGQGMGIILISSDMEEILGISDRLIVLSEGKYAGTLEKDRFSQTEVLKLASGE
ncbi:MAG: sugar ABC transporter ATP-binding protein [Clostridiales Family XIII bacterium]|jgi:ribose transport system ATP-binding protein|nr:sugar ABC transporter ATP-binding protein [Clostridiales Family XIII bacterium]